MAIKQRTFLLFFDKLVKIRRDDNFNGHLKTIFAIRASPSLLFGIGFAGSLLFGLFTGNFLGNSTLDIHLRYTYFIVSNVPLVKGTAVFFAVFCAIYYWFPKISGRYMNSVLAYIHFWITLIGSCLIFWPMQYENLAGIPRQYLDYSGWSTFRRFASPTQFVTEVALIVFAAQLIFLFNLLYSVFKGRKLTPGNIRNDGSRGWTVNYYRNLDRNRFSLWQYIPSTEILYPMLYGKIDTDQPDKDLVIRSRINPVGRCFSLICCCLLGYGLIADHAGDFPDWIEHLPPARFIVLICYFLATYLLFRQIDRHIKRKALMDLEENLTHYESLEER